MKVIPQKLEFKSIFQINQNTINFRGNLVF